MKSSKFGPIICKDTNILASYIPMRNVTSAVTTESKSDHSLCSYCHRIKPCRSPNNICTECINQMRLRSSLD